MTPEECIEYLEDNLNYAEETGNHMEQFSIKQCITLIEELITLRRIVNGSA